ncbi:MAG: two-component sensor histidine kinase [Microbacteriaceae bacterium]|nr:two-component sensor histidine kinase [Microbacteriaceae bacterium]
MVPESSSWLGRGLNLVGALVVGYYYTLIVLRGLPVWVVVVGYVALAAWVALAFVPRHALVSTSVIALVMLLGGSLATLPSTGTMVVLSAVAILRLMGDTRRPLWFGIASWLLAAAVVAAGVFIVSLPSLALIAIEGGLLIAALAGYSRRQFRETEQLARARAEEQATLTAQQHRQAVARDIHDVLAHSLGGLVIQLDAAGALLEAGKTADATARVTAARALAVDGLTEAKRAVEALRDDLPVEAVDLPGAIDDLVRAHRSLGGEANLLVEGVSHPLGAAASVAIARTLQEALTNARKHAPGMPVFVTVHWSDASVTLEISNARADRAVGVPGGGYGLEGMRERFAALPGSTLTAGADGDRFVVTATVAA